MALVSGSVAEFTNGIRAEHVLLVDASGNPISTFAGTGTAATQTQVTAINANTNLLAANVARKSFYIYNGASRTMLVSFTSPASATNWVIPIAVNTGQRFDGWTGIVTAIWNDPAVTGKANITEIV